jgi:hypothetical protein
MISRPFEEMMATRVLKIKSSLSLQVLCKTEETKLRIFQDAFILVN